MNINQKFIQSLRLATKMFVWLLHHAKQQLYPSLLAGSKRSKYFVMLQPALILVLHGEFFMVGPYSRTKDGLSSSQRSKTRSLSSSSISKETLPSAFGALFLGKTSLGTEILNALLFPRTTTLFWRCKSLLGDSTLSAGERLNYATSTQGMGFRAQRSCVSCFQWLQQPSK